MFLYSWEIQRLPMWVIRNNKHHKQIFKHFYIRGANSWLKTYSFSSHHHHHVVLVARISLTLSRHFSLSFIASGRSSGQYPESSHSCWMYVRAGRPAFARPCVGVHRSTSLMSSSLLLQIIISGTKLLLQWILICALVSISCSSFLYMFLVL